MSVIALPSARKPVDDPNPNLGTVLEQFTNHIDAIGHVLVSMVVAVQKLTEEKLKELQDFESQNCDVSGEAGERFVKVSNSQHREWKRLVQRVDHFDSACSLLPRSVMVSMVSQYDAFLGRLLKFIFLRKPEILNSSERKISFESLSGFKTIEDARDFILEKEIESILRSSHFEQFKWMEKAFDTVLTKDLAIWPNFIEITERRNLFVHTDGVVSSQYISVCRLHRCAVEDSTKEGSQLGVPQAYFEAAHDCIYQLGVMLCHVLWRKLFPDERKDADSNFSKVTYELIDAGRYDLAIRLLEFAAKDIKKYSSEVYQLMLTVNRAQAYKWKGDDAQCRKIMRAVDWSAKGDQYRLADHVLAEDWEKAIKVMKRIGVDGPVSKLNYRDWPLFRQFRKQEGFLSAYREIFGEDFSQKYDVSDEEPHLKALDGGMPESSVDSVSDNPAI